MGSVSSREFFTTLKSKVARCDPNRGQWGERDAAFLPAVTPSAVSGEDNVALSLRRTVRVLLVLVAVLDQQFRVRALLEVWLLRVVVCLAVLMLIELVQLDGFEQVLLGKRTESPCWRWTGVVLLAVLVMLERMQLDGFDQGELGKRTESPRWR